MGSRERPVVRCDVCERRFPAGNELGTALPVHVGVDGEPCLGSKTSRLQQHLRQCPDCFTHVQPLYLLQSGEQLPQHNRPRTMDDRAVEQCPGSGKPTSLAGPADLPRPRASATPASGISLKQRRLPAWVGGLVSTLIVWLVLVGALLAVVTLIWLAVTLLPDSPEVALPVLISRA